MDVQTEIEASAVKTRMRVARKYIVACLLLGAVLLAVSGVWSYNEVMVQRPLNKVLESDPRNYVVKARAHYDGWINPRTIVFDVTDVSGQASKMDVFRTFLQYAQAMKDSRVKSVILAAKGKKKFILDGDYFNQLGEEYDLQNPMYTIRTFPLHVTNMDGTQPYAEYTGGIFAVLGKEMEQFSDLHRKWYIEELALSSK